MGIPFSEAKYGKNNAAKEKWLRDYYRDADYGKAVWRTYLHEEHNRRTQEGLGYMEPQKWFDELCKYYRDYQIWIDPSVKNPYV